MRDLTITAIIKVYQYDELNESDRALVTTAKEATARSYVPYSHFSVGAADCWAMELWCPARIRKMPHIRRDSARNVPHCSMPTPDTPTSPSSHLLSPPERRKTLLIIRFLPAVPAAR